MGAANDGSEVLFPPAVRREALESFERRLVGARSPLADEADTLRRLLLQADSVLDDVAAGGEHRPARGAGDVNNLSREIGASRAVRGIHPVESLRAASVMFDALLPFV